MIKGIVFDCFGVLTTEGWQAFKYHHFRNDSEKLQRAQALIQSADEGKLTHKEFLPLIAELAGISEQQAHKEIDDYHVNAQLLDYIAELRKNYKIGMLSNISDNWLRQLFTKEQLTEFDVTALSYEVGATKPDPRAYQAVAERLQLRPEEIVFTDDLQHNVRGAEAVGMQGILYRDFDQFKAELEQLLDNTDTNK